MTQGKAEEGKGEGGPGGVSSRSPSGTVIRDPGNASASRSRKGGCMLETVNWRLTGQSFVKDKNTGAAVYCLTPMLVWVFFFFFF